MGWLVLDKPHNTGAMPQGGLRKTMGFVQRREESKHYITVANFSSTSRLTRFTISPVQDLPSIINMVPSSRRRRAMGAINRLWRTKWLRARILQANVHGDPVRPQPEHYRGSVNVNGRRQANVAFARAGSVLRGAESGAAEP
jgi:hypothetical protein